MHQLASGMRRAGSVRSLSRGQNHIRFTEAKGTGAEKGGREPHGVQVSSFGSFGASE